MASRTVTAAVTLPRLQVSGALRLCPAIVSAPLVLPKLQVAATVTIRSPSGMSATIALPKLQASGALRLCPAIVSAPLVLPRLQVAATVTISSLNGVSATIALPQLQASGALRLCPAIVSAPLVLPKLQVAGAVRVRHFARCGVVYSVAQEVDGASLTLRYWTVARDAACAQRVGWSLSVPMGWQGQIDYEGPRRLVALGVVYSIRLAVQQRFAWRLPLIAAWGVRYGSRMGVDWLAQWGASPSARAQLGIAWGVAPSARAQLGLAWGASPSARAQLGIAWGVAPSARAQLGLAWGGAPSVRAGLGLAWGGAPSVRADMGLAWGATGGLRVVLGVGYSLRSGSVRRTLALAAPLDDRYNLRRQWGVAWALSDVSAPPTGAGVVPVPLVTLRAGGRDVPFLGGLSLAQDVRDGLWRLQATVGRPVARGEAVALTMGASTWQLLATEGSSERADVLADGHRLVAASAPALWDVTPIGQLLGRAAWHTGAASTLARALAAPASLAWALPDVQLPATLVHEALWGLSRWQAIARLARACGGWALVSPDGSTITCRSAGTNQGRHVPLEASWRDAVPVAVLVSNRTVADSIADDPAQPSVAGDTARHLLVRPVPWRDVALRATAPATLSAPTQTDIELTDTLDLTAGVGQLTRPMDTLLSAEVWPTSAGPLRWWPDDAGVWLDTPTHATARVRYRSRALAVVATSPTLSPTLITIEDTPT